MYAIRGMQVFWRAGSLFTCSSRAPWAGFSESAGCSWWQKESGWKKLTSGSTTGRTMTSMRPRRRDSCPEFTDEEAAELSRVGRFRRRQPAGEPSVLFQLVRLASTETTSSWPLVGTPGNRSMLCTSPGPTTATSPLAISIRTLDPLRTTPAIATRTSTRIG